MASELTPFLALFRKILGISPDDHFYALISGAPGAGKTIVTYELLWHYLQEGTRSLYITTEDTPQLIMAKMKRFGWNVEPFLTNGRLAFIDMYSWRLHSIEKPMRTDYGVMIEPFAIDSMRPLIWEELLAIFKEYPTRVLFDCASTPFSGQGPKDYLSFLKGHIVKVKEIGSGVATLVSGVLPPRLESSALSLFDILIETQVEYGDVPRRYFRVVKSSGKHVEERLEYRIGNGGIEVYGRPFPKV